MALTKTVTKLWPVIGRRNIATIGLHLKLEDDGNTVIDKDVTETYNEGQEITPITEELLKRAQRLVNKYIAEKKLNSKTVYSNSIQYVDDNLNISEE